MLLLNAPHRPNSTLKIIKVQLAFHVDYLQFQHDIRLSQSVSFWIYRIITCAVIFRFGLQLLYNDGAWKIWSKTFRRVVKVHFLSTFWVFHNVMYLPWTVYWTAYVSNLLVNRHMDKQNEVLMEAQCCMNYKNFRLVYFPCIHNPFLEYWDLVLHHRLQIFCFTLDFILLSI
jgi:hypothetical protein